jgi:hypothetical protein
MPATYEPIATNTLGTATANITFSSIPATYTDLKLVIITAPSDAATQYIDLQFNSDTATNYSIVRLYGYGTGAGSAAGANSTNARVGIIGGSTTKFSVSISNIFSYAGSTFKTAITDSASDINGSGQNNRIVNTWRSTSAITSIKIFMDNGGNMVAGTTATLYGIKAA